MRKADVYIGGRFVAKVSGRIVAVRLTGENRYGGWDAVNEDTGRTVRIRSAAKLRRPAAPRAEAEELRATGPTYFNAPTVDDCRSAPTARALVESSTRPGYCPMIQ